MDTSKKKSLYTYLIFVFLLNVFDLALTMYWISIFGPSIELNPIMQGLLLLNPLAAIGLKLLAGVLFCLAIIYSCEYNFTFSYRATCWVLTIYALLAGWHVFGFLIQI